MRTLTAIVLSVLISMPLLLADGHIHEFPASEVSCDYCSFSQVDWVDVEHAAVRIEVGPEIRLLLDLPVVTKRFFYRRKPRGPPFLC
ncbi:MAG: hypothetical protein HOC70_02520 [Gammaproteobacteria bacterium]|jgi:hypothetical protein|nr:hypothetical protein [Gammaproteobacteria bacterium]MBT4492088.1 hypothetical protein [Gammaproteobacteria bacterium]MBT7369594.1 hypothetical protein [Gammaproteobacteria bacterium]